MDEGESYCKGVDESIVILNPKENGGQAVVIAVHRTEWAAELTFETSCYGSSTSTITIPDVDFDAAIAGFEQIARVLRQMSADQHEYVKGLVEDVAASDKPREVLRIGPRKAGVPSQEEMYEILKARSIELQTAPERAPYNWPGVVCSEV